MSATSPIRWPAEAIWEAVSPLLPGFTVEVLPTIDSTNTELMRRARNGQCEPTLLVAEQQTAGRGRLGRVWQSGVEVSSAGPPQAAKAPLGGSAAREAASVGALPSLMMSLGLPLAPQAAQAVAPQTNTSTARYVVVGIGINVLPRSPEGMSMPPGSLQEVEPGLDAPTALQRIVPPLVAMLQSFAGYGFAPMQPRFAARDVLQGRAVTLSDGHTGTAHGVGDDGALLVHTAGGMQAITSSEISVRPTAVPPV